MYAIKTQEETVIRENRKKLKAVILINFNFTLLQLRHVKRWKASLENMQTNIK
jgi:hypothetical protein